MSTVTVNFPPGIANFVPRPASGGTANPPTLTANASNQATIDPTQVSLADLLAAGFTVAIGVGATGSRPTSGLYPGMTYLDTTLNAGAGMLIVRNAANSGWMNPATGAAV